MAKQRARRTSPLYLPSAFELFTPSKDLFMKYFGVFGVLYVLPLLFWLHSWVDTPAHHGSYWNRMTDANYGWTMSGAYNVAFIGFSILWLIFCILFGTVYQIMAQRAQLDVLEDKEPSLGRSWQTVKEMWQPLLKLYVVMIVFVGVWFLPAIVISDVLLPVGLVGLFVYRRYLFAPFVMFDKKCDVKEALEKSHELSNKNSRAVWGVIGVLVLIGFIGVVPIIGSLASFILGALYSIAPAIRYRQLKKLG